MKCWSVITSAGTPTLPTPASAFDGSTNEEASSGGLVCGLQRRVYQDDSSSVHSHRTALSTRPQKASGDGRRYDAITAHSPRRQPIDTAPALQTLPPPRRCFAAHPHDILFQSHEMLLSEARHMLAVNARAELRRPQKCQKGVSAMSHHRPSRRPGPPGGMRIGRWRCVFQQPVREDVRPDSGRDLGGRALDGFSREGVALGAPRAV